MNFVYYVTFDQKTSYPPKIVSILDFGAKGDGKTDNRIAIQKAINSGAHFILIPKGTFVVSLDPTLTTPEGGKGIAINVISNLTLFIEGKLLLKSGSVGNSSSIIGNTESVKGVHIIGRESGTIDGNRNEVRGSIIIACLWNATDCSYESLKAVNGSYFGLGFRGIVPGYGRNRMLNCSINNMAYIGIQVAKPSLGFLANYCKVSDCGDNGIDIEGNNPAGDPGYGKNVLLKNCTVSNVANGVFIESVGGVTLTRSTIDHARVNAVYINRINSGSFGNKIINNKFLNTPDGTGVNFNSYVGETEVSSNYFENFKQSLYLNGGATDVRVGINKHTKIRCYLVNIGNMANSAVRCIIDEQILLDGPKDGFPETTSPLNNPANAANRAYLTIVKPAYSLKRKSKLPGTFTRTKTKTSKNSNWGAYSIYFHGKTIQYFPTNPPAVGEYVKINNKIFFVASNTTSGEYILQSPKGVDGDYTLATNGSFPVLVYNAAWMEN